MKIYSQAVRVGARDVNSDIPPTVTTLKQGFVSRFGKKVNR